MLTCHPYHGVIHEVSLSSNQPHERKVPAVAEYVPSPASLTRGDPPCATCMPSNPVGCGHSTCVMMTPEKLVA